MYEVCAIASAVLIGLALAAGFVYEIVMIVKEKDKFDDI